MHEANFANYEPQPSEADDHTLADPDAPALDLLHGHQALSPDAHRSDPALSYLEDAFERELVERQKRREPSSIACARALMMGIELRAKHAPSAPNSDEQL